MSYCAIDFGTSNSALALPAGDRFVLAELEAGYRTMPTAVFHDAGDGSRRYGRAAIAAYVDGDDGRLMRSLKSILGSDLLDEATDIAPGRSVRYFDVIVGFLAHLRALAETQSGSPVRKVLLGRPVYFVDDDPQRDARAQDALRRAARAAGFDSVSFEFEPLAAARDYGSRCADETLVLVSDIGGGTSDFSVVRIGPGNAGHDARGAILANHGVHVAGTDFDRALNLACLLPLAGYRSLTPEGREVPAGIYFDLATWHLINTTYSPARVSEIRRMRPVYADALLHARLLGVLRHRLGHRMAGLAEQAKIEVSNHGAAEVDLGLMERRLRVSIDARRQHDALKGQIERIASAARETVRLAGVDADAVQVIYFTGGSTALPALSSGVAVQFPRAKTFFGDQFTSVASGLALAARAHFP